MRSLTFRYSLDYYDFIAVVTDEFEAWLYYELSHGGATAVRVDHKIVELVSRYVPSSPRQLMELGMQCEALLDINIEDPIFGYQAEDAYEALRIAVSRFVGEELETRWEQRKEQAAEPVADLRPRSNGNGSNGNGWRLGEDGLADAA
jgi:hypothetical protein